jgi:dTDP-4-dehydrorhamnose reductase
MKLLVTGASGLLGTKLCQTALRRGHRVYAAYNEHEPAYGTPVKLDILDTKAQQNILNKKKPDAIVHAAALTDVDKCELQKKLAWKTNVEATENLARLNRKHDAFMVYVSTDYVFDGKKGMYTETDKPAPINYYGLTKLKGEEAVQTLNNYCIARGSVIFGLAPATGKTNFVLWLLDKLRRKEEVRIVTDRWNSPTLNISMAEMIIEAVEKRINGTLHLAGATRLSRYELAQHVAEVFNLDSRYIKPVKAAVAQVEWTAKRPKDASLNVNKAERTLAIKPLEVQEALERMKDEMPASRLFSEPLTSL